MGEKLKIVLDGECRGTDASSRLFQHVQNCVLCRAAASVMPKPSGGYYLDLNLDVVCEKAKELGAQAMGERASKFTPLV